MENESLPIKLSNVPLIPCTLSSFQNRGFMTTRDVSDAKKGGIRSLADELEVSLQDAIALSREVEGAYRSVLGDNHSEYTSHSTTFLEGEAPQLSERDTTSAIQGAYDTVEILEVSEKILEKMLAEVGGVECISNTNKLSPSYRGLRENSDVDETLENPNLGESNCRIQVKEVSPQTNHIPKTDSDDSSNDNIMTNGVNSLSDANYHLVPSRSYLKQECQKPNERSLPQGEIHRNKRKPRELLSNQKDTQCTDFGIEWPYRCSSCTSFHGQGNRKCSEWHS